MDSPTPFFPPVPLDDGVYYITYRRVLSEGPDLFGQVALIADSEEEAIRRFWDERRAGFNGKTLSIHIALIETGRQESAA